jgi:hypothetical protein
MWHTWVGGRDICTRFWWEGLKEGYHSKDRGIDGIRTDLAEIGGGEWIQLGEDGDRW